MKKLIFLISIALLTMAFWSGAKADIIYSDVDTMRVGDGYGFPGDTVIVPVIMSNSVSIEGMQHRIIFDPSLLDVDTVYCVDRGCNLEYFALDTIPDPGEISFLSYTFAGNRIHPGIGQVVNISFIVKDSAIPGETSDIEFQNQVNYGENAWTDSLGLNLIVPQLIPGTFSVRGGGVNLAPIINYIGPQSVAEGQLLQFNVLAHDPEADPLTLSARNLPANATFPTTQGDSLVTATFSFTPDYTQGPDTFNVIFSVSDDHNNVTELPVQIVVFDQPNDRIEIVSNQGGIPGAAGRPVDIRLLNTAPIYGVQMEILFDPAIIDISDINSTQRSNHLWFNSNVPEPGRAIIMMFSVGLDSIAIGQGAIVQLVTDVVDDTLFGPTNISFASAIEVIDSVGTAKDLDAEDGFFTVDRYGDANLDGIVNVGDCLSIVAYIIGVHSFSVRQIEAADYNSNTFVDIGDLQEIINFILELDVILLPGSPPSGPPAFVGLEDLDPPWGDHVSIPVNIDLPFEASAVQFEIHYNSNNLQFTELGLGGMASDMVLDYHVEGGALKCVIYNPGGGSFGPESGLLAELNFDLLDQGFDLASEISISDFALVNPSADFMPVEIRGQLPTSFVLGQNYPNPFNASTIISFNLPQADKVKLQVYDLLGRSVVTLQDDFLQAGSHTVEWNGRSADGSDLASGVYFYRLQAGTFDKTKKMLLIK